ncbi:MAG: hypothetical protein IPO33_08115 [Saprospiraceae bacterium]|nr:hypothetical protein [Candidatus Brachybacter algidus]
MRWWGLGSLVFLVFLSWGKYFPAFNYFLFDHFPLFNKFRAVSMAINLGHMVLLLIGLFGLREFFALDKESQIKAIKMTLIPMGVILLIGFWQGWMVNLSGSVDEQIKAFPDLISALHKDRAASVRSDVWRALFFVLAIGGFFYLYAKNQWKPGLALLIVPALILIDLVTVDKDISPTVVLCPIRI